MIVPNYTPEDLMDITADIAAREVFDEESMIARASAGLIARTRSGSDRDS
jgi:hypothetical protein